MTNEELVANKETINRLEKHKEIAESMGDFNAVATIDRLLYKLNKETHDDSISSILAGN